MSKAEILRRARALKTLAENPPRYVQPYFHVDMFDSTLEETNIFEAEGGHWYPVGSPIPVNTSAKMRERMIRRHEK